MTNQQALSAYAELEPIVGWPEWRRVSPGGVHRRLRLALSEARESQEWECHAWLDGGWSLFNRLHDHEALCIWRDHVRRWIDDHAHRCMISSEYECLGGERFYKGMVADSSGGSRVFGDTYDEALISAAKWVAEQKGDG